MAETERDEAKRRRAEGRRRRREGAQETQNDEHGDLETTEPLEGVKHAAKVAAAAAAVGAAVGAARALTGNGSDEEPAEPEPAAEHEQEPEPAASQPEPPPQEPPPQEPEEQRQPEREERPRYDEGQPSGASPDEARRVVASAREALAALLGKEPESVSGLDRNGDGWLVTLEVVELQRIPESTDVLASYELELDGDRKLVRYQRGRRYHRSQADDGEAS